MTHAVRHLPASGAADKESAWPIVERPVLIEFHDTLRGCGRIAQHALTAGHAKA
jgi:hypothetical protein